MMGRACSLALWREFWRRRHDQNAIAALHALDARMLKDNDNVEALEPGSGAIVAADPISWRAGKSPGKRAACQHHTAPAVPTNRVTPFMIIVHSTIMTSCRISDSFHPLVDGGLHRPMQSLCAPHTGST